MAYPTEEELHALRAGIGLHWGIVAGTADALTTGEIQVRVMGLCSKEPRWAKRIGFVGTGNGWGSYSVPQVGAQVLVGIVGGDPLDPELVYWPGPVLAKDTLIDIAPLHTGDQSKGFAFFSPSFSLVIIDTKDKQVFRIGNAKRDCYLEIDAAKGMIEIKMRNQVVLNAKLVDLSGLIVQLQKRVVSMLGSKQIA